MSKIKKRVDQYNDYHIYETEDGKKGVASKNENIKVGDKVNIVPITSTHPFLHKIEEKTKEITFEISWVFSKM